MKPRTAFTLLIPIVLLSGLWFFQLQSPPKATVLEKSPPQLLPAVPAPQTIAKPHLELAEKRIFLATRNHFASITSLFERSRSQLNTFAKSALGWGSKWRIVADAVPFSRGDRHAEYLKEQFELKVLKGDDLTRAIEQSVTEFLAEIRSIENRMLVDLRVDVADF